VSILPAIAVWAIVPTGSVTLLIVSVPLAMALSLVAASTGSAIWKRRPGSRDLIFADLMLWGWVRRVRAERRLADARQVLALTSPDRRVESLEVLSGLLEARDAYTHGHTQRVTRHAERIAQGMSLSAAEVAKVRTAAALHDVGKIHIPREILNKPGRLTPEEFAVIQRHPGDGADMLAGIRDPDVTAMVRHHHERLDGAGYPDGLAGEEIPLGARIIAVADTFDAMTSSRSYRKACGHKKALDVLAEEAGAQLDAGAVTAFLSYYLGKRSAVWSAGVTTVPQRFLAWLGSSTQGVAQALPALGAVALIAATPGGAAVKADGAGAGDRARLAQAQASRVAGAAPEARRSARAQSDAPRARAGARPRSRARQRREALVRTRRFSPRSSEPRGQRRAAGTPAGAPGSGPTVADRPGGGDSPAEGESQGGAGAPSREPNLTPVPAPVEQPDVQLPPVQLPPVQLPPVQLPPVGLPDVELPDVEVPSVEIPDVKLPGLPNP